MKKNVDSFVIDVVADAKALIKESPVGGGWHAWTWLFFSTDAFWILFLQRLRFACKRYHIPILGRIIRLLMLVVYGIEISPHAKLGKGVFFVHSVGVVIGGNAVVGDGTMFLGSNTLGTVNCENYPVVGCNVVIGAGARILDGTVVGDGASIGANAVVTKNIPANAIAVGVPARILER